MRWMQRRYKPVGNPLPYSMIDATDFQKFARVLVSTVETTIIRTVLH
jgi:lipoate-protein ligase B